MIIKRCDLCNKEVEEIDTMILYSKSFDYCEKCRLEAKSIARGYKERVQRQIKLRLKEEEIRCLQYINMKATKKDT